MLYEASKGLGGGEEQEQSGKKRWEKEAGVLVKSGFG
jgi:hypothetical protein